MTTPDPAMKKIARETFRLTQSRRPPPVREVDRTAWEDWADQEIQRLRRALAAARDERWPER